MRATDDAPDTTTEQRWQHIQDRLTRIRTRTLAEDGAAIAAIDTCLTRLDTLREDLARHPWTSRTLPTPTNSPAVPPRKPTAATTGPVSAAEPNGPEP
ncbi:hypothetical protein ACFXKJ_37740 [Kitasatospora indigofera]|uniref:hypothetical protein n=1 Tax=Kitasatospora indigofera TaxID=67307 RepID=UPI00367E19A7